MAINVDDPEIDLLDINEGQITAIFRVIKRCNECGEELEESYPEVTDAEVEHEHAEDLEIEEGDVFSVERTEGKGQGMKKFYGAMTTAVVTCSKCDFREEVELKADTQASSFDSLI